MNLVNVTARAKSKSRNEYYVYFDEWTGEISSVGCSQQSGNTNPELKTTDSIVKAIIDGNVNQHDYLVALNDHNQFEVIKKDNIIRLRHAEDQLVLLPRIRLNKWDVRVRLYTGNDTMTIELNRDSIQKLVNSNLRSDLKLEEKQDINLYITRRNQPDYLIERLQFDLADLLDTYTVGFDASFIAKYAGYQDIDILTKRNFKNYYLEILDASYQVPDTTTTQNKHIFTDGNEASPHFVFEQQGSKLIVTSKIKTDQWSELGLHRQNQICYVTGETPDQLIETITIDTVKMRRGRQEIFTLDADINQCRIVHRNPNIRISKRKSQ
jgi:hypothetical protein